MHVDPDKLSYCQFVGQFVKRVRWQGEDMIVKYGEEVLSSEAEVMQLVREQTSVPVPEVRLLQPLLDLGVLSLLTLSFTPGPRRFD